VQRLLEAFVSRGQLPQESYQVRDPGGLPPKLRRLLAQAIEAGRVWGCWAHGPCHWLFTAEMSLPLSRERGAAVLQVNRYDDYGNLEDSGTWIASGEDSWQRCAD
jgi:hypothetical protein